MNHTNEINNYLMETDKTTLNDLSIFNHDEEFSIFNKLNFTRTVGGVKN